MFSILQRYIYKELSKAFLLTLFILTSIFFLVAAMQMVRRYSQFLSFIDLITLSPYILGNALSLTIPMAMLAATTLVYGRLSQDKEILVLRAAGIHAREIFRPAFFIGLLLAGICLYLNAELVPYTYVKQKEIRYQAISVLLKASFGKEETTIDYIPNLYIYYKRLHRGKFRELVIQHARNNQVIDEILARTGSLVYDRTTRMLTFHLENGSISHINRRQSEKNGKSHKSHEERLFFKKLVFPVPLTDTSQKVKLDRAKYKNIALLVQDMNIWYENSLQLASMIFFAKRAKPPTDPAYIKGLYAAKAQAYSKYNSHLVELHNRFAMALAPLLVVFVGASLGLIIQHSNRLVAFGVSAIPVILIYYPLQIWGETMAEKQALPVFLGVWLSNFVTGGLGIGLLWHVYRK